VCQCLIYELLASADFTQQYCGPARKLLYTGIIKIIIIIIIIIIGKFHHRTGHKGPEGEKRCSSTLSLHSALDLGWVVNAMPRPLYPRERPSTHSIGGWVGPRAGLDRCRNSRPNQESIPGPSSP
jgi:hypothetical protein